MYLGAFKPGPYYKTHDKFTTASVTLEPQDVSNQNPCYPADKEKKLLF
jgi:hypothetical protein